MEDNEKHGNATIEQAGGSLEEDNNSDCCSVKEDCGKSIKSGASFKNDNKLTQMMRRL